MLVIVNVAFMQNHARTVILQYSILFRKEVQLLSRVSHKHFNHETRQAFEWNAMVSRANVLFDGPVVVFSFGYMLLRVGIIHFHPKIIGKWVHERSKLVVTLSMFNSKSSHLIDAKYLTETGTIDHVGPLTLDILSCTVVNVLQNGSQE
jgi:hypothetical protein